MVSPPSNGLFHRVIMQSNPAGFSYTTPGYMAVYGDVRTHGAPHVLAVSHPFYAQALARQAGCGRPPKGVSQLDCLRNVSTAVIAVRVAWHVQRALC